jgi:DNA-binding TFAR19-related protein (PDSD5 family)
MAQQLATALGLSGDNTSATANTPEDYFNFLMETLQKVSENPNPQSIYPFWAQHIDKLDENLAQILESWARETLTQVTSEEDYDIAEAIFKKLDENLAQILESWARERLTQVTPEEAYYIAEVIFKFSNLIQKFPLGNIAANKEIAITGYEIALNVVTFDAFPQQWGITQNNLANAYRERIREDKAENLERAIAFYQILPRSTESEDF